MDNNKNIPGNISGCIQQDKLIAYLKGKLPDREMNLVEKHLAICPMCSDELEGLSRLDNPSEIKDIEGNINKKIDGITQNKKRKTITIPYPLRIAASILFIFAITALIYYTIDITGTSIEISEYIQVEEESPAATEKEIPHIDPDVMPPEKPVMPEEKEEEIVEYREEETVEPVDDIYTAITVAESPPPVVLSDVKEDSTIDAEGELNSDIQVTGYDARSKTAVKKEEQDIEAFETMADKKVDEHVFALVEEMPVFIHDDYDDFAHYIAKNIGYPSAVKEKGIEGTVFVSFQVETDGKVSNVKIIRGVHSSLDDESIRVISSSPNWQPGKQRNVPVKVKLTFPVRFVAE